VFQNKGQPNTGFISHAIPNNLDQGENILIDDMNGDGNPDLLATSKGSGPRADRLYLYISQQGVPLSLRSFLFVNIRYIYGIYRLRILIETETLISYAMKSIMTTTAASSNGLRIRVVQSQPSNHILYLGCMPFQRV